MVLHAHFDLAPTLSQVGWLSNLLVEGLLVVEAIIFIYFTKSIFYKSNNTKRGSSSFSLSF